jgi:APA family basic amino acid/polyamine antiporter
VPEENAAADGLRRSLSLWQVVLYGLGVTIGAGIYVLVGVAAGKSGTHAPLAFIAAAVLLSFTAGSLAELGTRMPVSASEAAYVEAGFSRKWLTLSVGLIVVGTAAISAATVSVGAAGYVAVFITAPEPLLVAMIVIAMGLIASLTTAQSVTLAGLMTLVEIGGLLAVLTAGLLQPPLLVAALPTILPGFSADAWTGIIGTSLLAVFAFIGFEHVVNIAEEVRDPNKVVPRAIFLTLGLTTALYAAVVFVAIAAVAPAELALSNAPLALAYERLTGHPLGVMSAIAVIATLNGIVVHMIMISRVLYGLSRAGDLPAGLAHLAPRTRTPVRATMLAVVVILTLALIFPIEQLAQFTAQGTLAIFVMINAALIQIKRREITPPKDIFLTPAWMPYAGLIANLILLLTSGFARD